MHEAGVRSSEVGVGLRQPHSQGPPRSPMASPTHNTVIQVRGLLTHDSSPRWCCDSTACMMTMAVAASCMRMLACVWTSYMLCLIGFRFLWHVLFPNILLVGSTHLLHVGPNTGSPVMLFFVRIHVLKIELIRFVFVFVLVGTGRLRN